MKILILDIAASSGGALTVLNNILIASEEIDESDVYFEYMVSQSLSSDSSNINILRYDWVKKSWIHRLYFDYIKLPKIVKINKYDKIFSLQNIGISRINVKQYIYLHQSLPFVAHKFNIIKEPLLWVYQNLISILIKKSIKKVNILFVQTNWMKNAIVNKCSFQSRIIVSTPSIDIESIITYKNFVASCDFFYPATSHTYKNHSIILEACKLLTKDERERLSFSFTLSGDENKYIIKLKKDFEILNVRVSWLGVLPKDEVLSMYGKFSLIFPSYVETFGLPLLEAKLSNTYIISSKTDFASEILDGYRNKSIFDYNNPIQLSRIFQEMICGKKLASANYQMNDIEVHEENWVNMLNTVIHD